MNSMPILLLLALLASCQAVQVGDNMSRRVGVAFLEGAGVPPDFHTAMIIARSDDKKEDGSSGQLIEAIRQMRGYVNDGDRKYLVICVVYQGADGVGATYQDGIVLRSADMKNATLSEQEVYAKRLFSHSVPFVFNKETKSREWVIVTKFQEQNKKE